MRTTSRPAAALAAALAAFALAACGSAAAPDAPPAASATRGGTPSAEGAGGYVELADYQADPAAHAGTRVVLFFHADWCPSCRATEKAVQEKGVPAGLTLVKVDFDTETDLRREYGVTQQHTFVQVDGSGAALGKWSGSADAADVLARTV